MLIFLIVLMAFYTLYKLILSALQIKFVRENLGRKAVILDEIEYKKVGHATIINEKFEIFSNLYSFFIFLFWIFFGLGTLASLFDTNKIASGAIFVLSYIIIGAIFALPLSVYETFVKDKKLGFSNTTAKIFITDSIKSLILMLIFGFLADFWRILFVFCVVFFGLLIYNQINFFCLIKRMFLRTNSVVICLFFIIYALVIYKLMPNEIPNFMYGDF